MWNKPYGKRIAFEYSTSWWSHFRLIVCLNLVHQWKRRLGTIKNFIWETILICSFFCLCLGLCPRERIIWHIYLAKKWPIIVIRLTYLKRKKYWHVRVSYVHSNLWMLNAINISGTLCSPYRYAIHIYFNKILIGTSFLHCWCVPKYFSQTSFFFCYPANPKSKLTKFKLQKNQNLTKQYSKCYQEVAKNLCMTKGSNV